jgi:hypothetical protein
MDKATHSCSEAFHNKDADNLASCSDADFVMIFPNGGLRGRDHPTNPFQQQYFGTTPDVHLSLTMSTQRTMGEVLSCAPECRCQVRWG